MMVLSAVLVKGNYISYFRMSFSKLIISFSYSVIRRRALVQTKIRNIDIVQHAFKQPQLKSILDPSFDLRDLYRQGLFHT